MSVEILGIRESRPLVVNGWTVPMVEVNIDQNERGDYLFTLDHRFGVSVPKEKLQEFGWFVAECIAVALGLPCAPRESDARPFDLPIDEPFETFCTRAMERLHPALRPTHPVCISSTESEEIPLGPRAL